jgi:lysophospholipase L1-like esterase
MKLIKQRNFLLLLLCSGLAFTSIAQQKLDKFESSILKFEEEDKNNGYDSKAVLFTGSSSIKMWKSLESDMSPIPVINRGFGGSTIPEVTFYAARVILPHRPEIVVFYCGENDLANDHTTGSLALESFKAFHTFMKQNLPETKVFFIAIKPAISRWKYWSKMSEANKKLKNYMNGVDNYYFIDTASKMLDKNGNVLQDIFIKDNLHMNEKGYAIWTGVIKLILEEHYDN